MFSGRAFRGPSINNETMSENPVETNDQYAKDANIAVRGLGMKGKEDNISYFNKYQGLYTKNIAGDIGQKIRKMNDIYQLNSKYVGEYSRFLDSIWEMGSVGDNAAQQILRQILEDPDNSQKLLSAFFYYNP